MGGTFNPKVRVVQGYQPEDLNFKTAHAIAVFFTREDTLDLLDPTSVAEESPWIHLVFLSDSKAKKFADLARTFGFEVEGPFDFANRSSINILGDLTEVFEQMGVEQIS